MYKSVSEVFQMRHEGYFLGLPFTKAPVELSYESPRGKSIHSGCPNSLPMKFKYESPAHQTAGVVS